MIGFNKKIEIFQDNGYTLLETIVGVSIFTVVILSAMSVFQLVIKGQRQAVASQNTQESVRFAFEVMSKELRTAIRSSGDCGVNGIYKSTVAEKKLDFRNQYGECVTYSLSGDRLRVSRDDGATVSTGFLTPDEVIVSSLDFNVKADSPSSQSAVTINMTLYNKAFSQGNLYKSQIDLQTTISSRVYQ